jgi:hypothetical protein
MTKLALLALAACTDPPAKNPDVLWLAPQGSEVNIVLSATQPGFW